ncbi:hypothetical protein EDC56_2218 [Sinobacterium caligoides]|uniref:Lipoprotein n=1 Tax=Sinobacterium caligoides TaxID=933926 RepID=A0A3N2DPQ0_9GAMM|nr:hypothetical protein [Sinobacterium caligoides]ROS01773.1 hypothetical protein EDC56_2218 [Sinobacterium caligoides]
MKISTLSKVILLVAMLAGCSTADSRVAGDSVASAAHDVTVSNVRESVDSGMQQKAPAPVIDLSSWSRYEQSVVDISARLSEDEKLEFEQSLEGAIWKIALTEEDFDWEDKVSFLSNKTVKEQLAGKTGLQIIEQAKTPGEARVIDLSSLSNYKASVLKMRYELPENKGKEFFAAMDVVLRNLESSGAIDGLSSPEQFLVNEEVRKALAGKTAEQIIDRAKQLQK